MFTFRVMPRKVWPRYQNKPVRTHPVAGLTNRILVAHGTGHFYVQYWEEGEQRGDKKVRRWRRYEDIWSLSRGLRLARSGTVNQRIPTLDELQRLCAEANITLNQRDVNAEDLQGVKRKMLRVLQTLHCPRTHALKEVVTQVECVILLRDSRGRLNLGALAARLVPVKNRLFVERLSDIVGWLGHYAHWEQDVELLQQLAGGFLSEMEQKLLDWISRLSDLAGWRDQVDDMSRETDIEVEHLTRLEPFGGWTNWARACRTDFGRAKTGLLRADRDMALTALRRLQQSVAIKKLQKEISDLLLDIQLDRFERVFHLTEYQDRLVTLLDAIIRIDDSDFRHRVVPELTEHLRGAQAELASAVSSPAFGESVDRKTLKRAYDHLREACRLL